MSETMGKALVFYETGKRKIQEDGEVLACQLQAGEWNGSFGYGYVYSLCAGLRMVGDPPTLNPKGRVLGSRPLASIEKAPEMESSDFVA